MDRELILKRLQAQVHINGHIVGSATGSGMAAKYSALGGADFVLAVESGKYRMMGRSSLAAFLCYGNNNEAVMELGKRELLPILKETPVLFGLMASDPFIHMYDYLKQIKKEGFSGIVNYPTLAMLDGVFREKLEEEGSSFEQEVEAIKLANYLNLFTVAFVTNVKEAKQMIEAGADVICVHLGLTKGGYLGAKKYISLEEAIKIMEEVFVLCEDSDREIIKMVYAGPANTPIDMQYIYQNTRCQGYIGGSTFDRIPTERAILNTARAFKSNGGFDRNDPMTKLIQGNWSPGDYVDFTLDYIEENYMKNILLSDIALVTHVSPSHLSIKFKNETGVNFTEYLIRFRMNKAVEYLEKTNMICREVAEKVGYVDYAQFSKIFKKYIGMSPKEYRKSKQI